MLPAFFLCQTSFQVFPFPFEQIVSSIYDIFARFLALYLLIIRKKFQPKE